MSAGNIYGLLVPRELFDLVGSRALAHLDASSVLPLLQPLPRVVAFTARIFYWAILAPLFWVLAYFCLTEIEVKNGV